MLHRMPDIVGKQVIDKVVFLEGNLTENGNLLPDHLAHIHLVSVLCGFIIRKIALEVKDVADFLAGRDKDRVAALQEVCWALLTSLEFRFCR